MPNPRNKKGKLSAKQAAEKSEQLESARLSLWEKVTFDEAIDIHAYSDDEHDTSSDQSVIGIGADEDITDDVKTPIQGSRIINVLRSSYAKAALCVQLS